MTVAELIAELQQMPPDAEVWCPDDYSGSDRVAEASLIEGTVMIRPESWT